MYTYNDLLECGTDEQKRIDFILTAIADHKKSDIYKWAVDADLYIRQKNSTIMNYVKFLYTLSGNCVPDNYSANHKTASNFYKRFITQEIEYLLANGVSFTKEETKKKLGDMKFDRVIKKLAKSALNGAESFGFWDNGKIVPFTIQEYIPLLDEEDGSMKAGIRFWRLADNKPMRATLYEMDGFTDYMENDKGVMKIKQNKRPYKQFIRTTEADGEEIYGGENYPTFPIVPMWGNDEHQSELVGVKTEIDAYDLIKSGFANDLDDVSQIYWILQNAGGMDEEDIAKFLDQIKRTHAASLDEDGATAEAHTIEIPYQSRETYLTRLESDMYYDAMAMNAKDITAGNITATAIKAAYDNLDQKANELMANVEEFIDGILVLAGIDDKPSFKMNRISNDTEMTQNILSASEYLDLQTILEKLPFVNEEEVPIILERLAKEELDRYEPLSGGAENEEGQGEEMDGQTPQRDGETHTEDLP